MKSNTTDVPPVGVSSLPLVLRKDNSLVLATFSEEKQLLTEMESTSMSGDYRECEVCFNPARRTAFAHATTTHVRYSEVVPAMNSSTDAAASDTGSWRLNLLFEVEERNTVALAFSVTGAVLVTYSVMDSKRPDGNMALYNVSTGALLHRCVQALWPGMVWTHKDLYSVRPVQGCLHVLKGDIANEGAVTLSKMDLQLPRDKEIELSMCPSEMPILALFKPFYGQTQGTLSVYRLPNLEGGAMFQATFGRAESSTLLWSVSGNHLAVLVKCERDASGKSYYGTVSLHLADVGSRKIKQIKFPSGESVHDCQWSPTADELMVVHGTMPVNKTTLYDKTGAALMTFGEAPRNVVLWSPNGRFCALGGTGNLAGDFVFFDVHPPSSGNKARNTAEASCTVAVSTGDFNQKCSVQLWAPDSHIFLCAIIFTRLRIDNKLVFYKNNGEHLLTQKYPILYGAHWVQAQPTQLYPIRHASPRKTEARPKPQPYRPPHASAAASALLRRPDSSTPKQAKPAGPPGATVVVQKKKRSRTSSVTMRRWGTHGALITQGVCASSSVPPRERGNSAGTLAAPLCGGGATVEGAALHSRAVVRESVRDSVDRLLGRCGVRRDARIAGGAVVCGTRNACTASARRVLPPYYKPMNLGGVLYEGDVALQLVCAAESRCSRSPVWATRASFLRYGHVVLEGEAGVEVSTAMHVVTLYNLQQTNAPEATLSALVVPQAAMPLSAAGRPLCWRMRTALTRHPLYGRFSSPYWVSEEEAVALRTVVKDGERCRGVSLPRYSVPGVAPAAASGDFSTAAGEACTRAEESLVLYNAEQLVDPSAASEESCPRVECVSVDGRLYSPLFTIHMRRHCWQHQLRMDPVAAFVTCARLRSLGGESVAGAGLPLTLVVRDELITLYHADQTTLSDSLLQRALAVRRGKVDRVRAAEV